MAVKETSDAKRLGAIGDAAVAAPVRFLLDEAKLAEVFAEKVEDKEEPASLRQYSGESQSAQLASLVYDTQVAGVLVLDPEDEVCLGADAGEGAREAVGRLAAEVVERLGRARAELALDELVHDIAAPSAADANNGGVEAQVAYLVEALGADEARLVLFKRARQLSPERAVAIYDNYSSAFSELSAVVEDLEEEEYSARVVDIVRERLVGAAEAMCGTGLEAEIVICDFAGKMWALTGGMSYGDYPTEAYEEVALVGDAGIGDEPVARGGTGG